MGNERHLDVTTISVKSLAFESGVHACPGRFFAASKMQFVGIEFENGRVSLSAAAKVVRDTTCGILLLSI